MREFLIKYRTSVTNEKIFEKIFEKMRNSPYNANVCLIKLEGKHSDSAYIRQLKNSFDRPKPLARLRGASRKGEWRRKGLVEEARSRGEGNG